MNRNYFVLNYFDHILSLVSALSRCGAIEMVGKPESWRMDEFDSNHLKNKVDGKNKKRIIGAS